MDEALPILDHLPISFRQKSESDYIIFLWEAFESNYKNEKYQFAMLAYHMLYMSFVYFIIWKIRHVHPEKYKHASIFLAGRNLSESELISLTSPFSFSKIEERTIFRILRLIGCKNEDIKPFTKLVDERNDIAHSNGNIFFGDQKTADQKISEVLQQIAAIQSHMKPVIHDCFRQFLLDSYDPESRECADATDQIREVLIHANYFSQEDINACLAFDIDSLSSNENFPAVSELFETFSKNYSADE
jgi:hypothetical protein